MKIFDITQEVFTCEVYPGDPKPQKQVLCSMQRGDLYNLTAFSMCAHNGTHIDAPSHFLKDGKTVEALPTEAFVGPAFVAEYQGIITEEAAKQILKTAQEADPNAAMRILIKGDAELSVSGASCFAKAGILLYGNESQSVGPVQAPMQVHRILLEKEVVLLEGIRLNEVPQGVYLLSAAPLLLSGTERRSMPRRFTSIAIKKEPDRS